MKTLIYKNEYYSLYKVSKDTYDSLEISLDANIWIEPKIDYSGQLKRINGKTQLLCTRVYMTFNSRSSNNYSIIDSKEIINEWTKAIEFCEAVKKYIEANNWLVD